MTSTALNGPLVGDVSAPGGKPPSSPYGGLGGRGTRVLAGPPWNDEFEPLADHASRLGVLQLASMDRSSLRAAIAESGLQGRGGGQFPVASKLELAAASGGSPLVVVNASEGEPASRKDRTLLCTRPHLILDGAMVAAHAVGARDVVIYQHRSHGAALSRALEERSGDVAHVRVVDAPERYVAGETSAVVGFLEGRGAIPSRRQIPVAASGVGGRPTVVSNAETVAHLALIARYGAAWFREAGDPSTPGSTLVTLAGGVIEPGTVVELLAQPQMGEVLRQFGGVRATPSAVLVGGYEGTWVNGSAAMTTPLGRAPLAARGARLGCGVLAVLPADACGLRTTARLVGWLASESAGQCGPCIYGLPQLSVIVDELADGVATRRDLRRLRLLSASVTGRGACGHPTGVAGLVDSALVVFAQDVDRHVRGRPCDRGVAHFPLPPRSESSS